MTQRSNLRSSKWYIYAAELTSSRSISRLRREQKEHKVFLALLKSVPGLEERIMNANSEEDVQSIAAMVSLFVMELVL